MEYICRQLSSGYARVTICNELGRWSMDWDVDSLMQESEKYVKLKDQTFFWLLKEYIAAYSLNPNEFITYIRKP